MSSPTEISALSTLKTSFSWPLQSTCASSCLHHRSKATRAAFPNYWRSSQRHRRQLADVPALHNAHTIQEAVHTEFRMLQQLGNEKATPTGDPLNRLQLGVCADSLASPADQIAATHSRDVPFSLQSDRCGCVATQQFLPNSEFLVFFESSFLTARASFAASYLSQLVTPTFLSSKEKTPKHTSKKSPMNQTYAWRKDELRRRSLSIRN